MKIIILIHNLTGGGAERVAAMWATGFCQKAYEVTLILFDNKSPITYSVPEQVSIKYAVSYKRNAYVRNIERIMKLHQILRKEKADVIIDVIPAFWKRFAMCGISGKKISTEHNSFERPDNAEAKYSKLRKIHLNRLYDYVTVLTQADKNVIGNQLKNVAVLPNPLALEIVKELPTKKKLILASGRLDIWHCKGFDVLIKAWAKIADQAEGWILQIAGDSRKEGLKFLQNLCEECGISESVMFLGYQKNILPFYKNASVFVLSSRYDGFGLVLIEAMSQGCACIACDYKGRQKEIVTLEKQGLICKPEDVDELSKKMLCLIKDDDKRREIGLNAIVRSQDFCINKIMEKWEIILKEILLK